MTQAPLNLGQLVPKPALQALIDHRLEYHEQRLRAYAQVAADLNLPANGVLQNAAQNENPHL